MRGKIQGKLNKIEKKTYLFCVFKINIQIECMEKLYVMNFPEVFTVVLLDWCVNTSSEGLYCEDGVYLHTNSGSPSKHA